MADQRRWSRTRPTRSASSRIELKSILDELRCHEQRTEKVGASRPGFPTAHETGITRARRQRQPGRKLASELALGVAGDRLASTKGTARRHAVMSGPMFDGSAQDITPAGDLARTQTMTLRVTALTGRSVEYIKGRRSLAHATPGCSHPLTLAKPGGRRYRWGRRLIADADLHLKA